MTQKNIIKALDTLFNNCCYTHNMIYSDDISAVDGEYTELTLISMVNVWGSGVTGIVRVYKDHTTIRATDTADNVIIDECILNKRISACGVNGRKFTMLIKNSLGEFILKIDCTDKNDIKYELY